MQFPPKQAFFVFLKKRWVLFLEEVKFLEKNKIIVKHRVRYKKEIVEDKRDKKESDLAETGIQEIFRFHEDRFDEYFKINIIEFLVICDLFIFRKSINEVLDNLPKLKKQIMHKWGEEVLNARL